MTIVNTLQENETLDNGLYFAIVVKKNYTKWKLVHKAKRIPWELLG